MKISQRISELLSGQDLPTKIFNYADGVTLFVLSYRLIVLYMCTKFCEKNLKGFRVIERIRFMTDRQTTMKKNNMSPPHETRQNFRYDHQNLIN